MEHDGAAELEGERELGFEDLAHERRDVAALEAVESDLAHARLGVGKQPSAEAGESLEEWD